MLTCSHSGSPFAFCSKKDAGNSGLQAVGDTRSLPRFQACWRSGLKLPADLWAPQIRGAPNGVPDFTAECEAASLCILRHAAVSLVLVGQEPHPATNGVLKVAGRRLVLPDKYISGMDATCPAGLAIERVSLHHAASGIRSLAMLGTQGCSSWTRPSSSRFRAPLFP